MAHVTFIHGIANKPAEPELLRIWRDALADGSNPLPLGDHGVTSTMVYWADLMYPTPETDLSAYESVLENTVQAVDGAGGAEPPTPQSPREQAFLDALRAHLSSLPDDRMTDAAPEVPADPQGTLERVPLPWALKKPVMNALLRDVHHYLFDVLFAPPGKTPVRIQQTIRERFRALLASPQASAPHIVVSHSMGTVIAYDCLKRLDGCARVDGLMTLGSPLGLDEIQDQLQPGWSRADGFPSERVGGQWVNVYDRLDPVCGFDPLLANDFRETGTLRVQDLEVHNSGAWRHSITKYLRQAGVRDALRTMLAL